MGSYMMSWFDTTLCSLYNIVYFYKISCKLGVLLQTACHKPQGFIQLDWGCHGVWAMGWDVPPKLVEMSVGEFPSLDDKSFWKLAAS